MALQPDGKIVVASHLYRDGANSAAAARDDVDGDLDPSFGEAGIADSGAQHPATRWAVSRYNATVESSSRQGPSISDPQ
jgi:hypothetical protein